MERGGRECEARWALLRVELLLLVGLLVRHVGLLGLLQRVTALVLLLHPVDEQHDQEGSKEGSHHAAHDHRCNTEKGLSRQCHPAAPARLSVQIIWGGILEPSLGLCFASLQATSLLKSMVKETENEGEGLMQLCDSKSFSKLPSAAILKGGQDPKASTLQLHGERWTGTRSLHRLPPHARRVHKVPRRALGACCHPARSAEDHLSNGCFAVTSPPAAFSWEWDFCPISVSLRLGQGPLPGTSLLPCSQRWPGAMQSAL